MRFPGLPGRWMLAFVGLVAVVGVLGAVVTASASAQPNGTCSYTEQEDVPAVMRDGTILRSNVFTPDSPGSYPVILMRLPYDKDVAQTYVYASPAVTPSIATSSWSKTCAGSTGQMGSSTPSRTRRRTAMTRSSGPHGCRSQTVGLACMAS